MTGLGNGVFNQIFFIEEKSYKKFYITIAKEKENIQKNNGATSSSKRTSSFEAMG